MKIIKSYLTKNACYQKKQYITPSMIMLHSTACPGVLPENFVKAWNVIRPNGNSVCVHAFIKPGYVFQTLPWNMRGWHCGGIGNNVAIGFEICEPKDYSDADYFKDVKKTAIELCAYLCEEFKIEPKLVTSHCEACRNYGTSFASNHSDLDHWWKKYFDYTMDDFRKELTEYIEDKEEEEMIRYQTIDEVPSWGQDSIKRAQELGIVKGTGKGLGLTETEVKVLVWMDRAGLFKE